MLRTILVRFLFSIFEFPIFSIDLPSFGPTFRDGKKITWFCAFCQKKPCKNCVKRRCFWKRVKELSEHLAGIENDFEICILVFRRTETGSQAGTSLKHTWPFARQ